MSLLEVSNNLTPLINIIPTIKNKEKEITGEIMNLLNYSPEVN
jgi:hypothetical protein